MNKISNHPVSLVAGLILNVLLMIYVYFFVEGGPAAVQQGGDWAAVWNEIPQTVLLFAVGVFLPYFMLWSRREKIGSSLSLAGYLMLGTTIIACVLIAVIHQTMMREITMDISWLGLWGVAAYFVLLPPRPRDE